jgi:hypothetical protein
MVHTPRATAIIVLSLSAAALAACGSSDSGDSSTLDRSALAAKADAICAAAPNTKSSAKSIAGVVAFLNKAIAARAKLYDELAALKPDDATKAQWDAVLADLKQANAYVPKLLAAAKAQDGLRYRQLLPPWFAADRKASAAATRLGTTHC